MNQIQELRTSAGEKSEAIDTLKQELRDISVSPVTGAELSLAGSLGVC